MFFEQKRLNLYGRALRRDESLRGWRGNAPTFHCEKKNSATQPIWWVYCCCLTAILSRHS